MVNWYMIFTFWVITWHISLKLQVGKYPLPWRFNFYMSNNLRKTNIHHPMRSIVIENLRRLDQLDLDYIKKQNFGVSLITILIHWYLFSFSYVSQNEDSGFYHSTIKNKINTDKENAQEFWRKSNIWNFKIRQYRNIYSFILSGGLNELISVTLMIGETQIYFSIIFLIFLSCINPYQQKL